VALWTFLDVLAVFFDGRLLAFFFGFCDFFVWLFLFSCSSSKARFALVYLQDFGCFSLDTVISSSNPRPVFGNGLTDSGVKVVGVFTTVQIDE